VCRPDDHDVFHNGRRGVQADLARLQIDLLAGAKHGPPLQIDDAVGAERADHGAGVRVERDEAIACADVEHAIVAAAVGPVRDPSARQLARRDAGAPPFAQAVRPHQLPCFPVERDNRPPGSPGGIQHAVDRQRRSLELVLGTRSQHVGLESPRHFEPAEVAGVDLIEGRVLGAAQVRGVVRPVAGSRGRLARGARAILTR
jgi:hypothetical protein